LDGVQKMSKSLNNYIGVHDAPEDMFGKVMSIPDDIMWRYFDLVSLKSNDQIKIYKNEVEQGKNPRDIKFELGLEIVERFHSANDAKAAHEAFIQRFQKNQIPDDLETVVLNVGSEGMPLANVLAELSLTASTSEAHRMVKQGAVRIDGEKAADSRVVLKAGETLILQVGKRRIARAELSN